MSTALNIINSALIELGQEKISSYPDTTTTRGVTMSEQYVKKLKELLRSHPWNFADKRTKISVASYDIEESDISVASNYIYKEAHGYVTGQKIQVSSSDTLPSPLVVDTDYFIIKSTSDRIKLASSLSNALAGTAITLTDDGTGTLTIDCQDITPDFGFDKQVILPSDFVSMQEVCSDDIGLTNIEYKVEGGKILTDNETFYIRYTYYNSDPTLFSDDFADLLSLKLAMDTAYDITGSREKEESCKAKFEKALAQVRFQDSRDGTHKPMQVSYFIRQRF